MKSSSRRKLGSKRKNRQSTQTESAYPSVRLLPETYAALAGIKGAKKGRTYTKALDSIVAHCGGLSEAERNRILGEDA